MAYARIPGSGMLYGLPTVYPPHTIGLSVALIDATGEKVAFIGPYMNELNAARDVTRVLWRAGTLTSAGGSLLRISLQSVDLANGPAQRPDGTILGAASAGYVDALLSGLTSGGYNRSGTLGATVTLTPGDIVCVVYEFDPGGRLSSDAINVAYVGASTAWSYGSHLTGAWALILCNANVLLEDTNGAYGWLGTGAFATNTSSQAFKQDTATADEYGTRSKFGFKAKVHGIWVARDIAANTSNYEAVLYNGTTEQDKVVKDGNAIIRVGQNWEEHYFGAEYEFAATDICRCTLRPTQTTSTVSLPYIDVNANANLAAMPGGIEMYQTRWLNGAHVDDTPTTRFPMIGPIISHIDDGASAGGGGGPLIGGRLVR